MESSIKYLIRGYLTLHIKGSDFMQTNVRTNRLAGEASPYLLQHASNPVDWYPWGDEAFERAKAEDKPILISIGYSTCHWCHVMAHESFEDEKVAEILNKDFIAIKVDREERPDIDHVYMTYCQEITGRGGWPLNLILRPDGKPFFASTYIPKEDKNGMKGFKRLLQESLDVYQNQREKIDTYCEEVHRGATHLQSADTGPVVNRSTSIRNVLDALMDNYDKEYGGFSKAPKFPMPHYVLAALYASEAFDVPRVRNAAENTLMMMRQGGIYDQIGYGFMRYATDEKWIIPHFEKMLYDNALLIFTYTEAYRLTGRIGYAETAHELIQFLNEEMLAPDGGFYAAQDADTEGHEGHYYLWTPEQIKSVVGEGLAGAVSGMIGIMGTPNFQGKWIPNRIEYSGKMDDELWKTVRKDLYKNRLERVRPSVDKKVLTGWNGLMVAALARSGAILKEDEYIRQAMKILDRIGGNDDPGDMLRGFIGNKHLGPAYFEDYAYVIWGLIELFKATKMPVFSLQAKSLARYCERTFKLPEGGYAMTGDRHEELVLRPVQLNDQAMPSGNGIHLWNLLRLSTMGEDQMLTQAATEHEKFMRMESAVRPLSTASSIIGLLRTGRLQ